MNQNNLGSTEKQELLSVLQNRFEQNMHRHKQLIWGDVLQKILSNENKLWSLYKMENSGGQPDIVDYNKDTNEYIFVDCAKESPTGRRSFCYDPIALEKRKENKPQNSALGFANQIGVMLLTEQDYKHLQSLEPFDTKTSSWLHTPDDIRKLGGAIFGDFRYGKVFIYHNGAESYYAARGFRGKLVV
ncbi:MAG: DUF4256 domain-containing protein [Bacteroidia bacterium]